MKSERRFRLRVRDVAPNVKARARCAQGIEARFIACANLIQKLSRLLVQGKIDRPARS